MIQKVHFYHLCKRQLTDACKPMCTVRTYNGDFGTNLSLIENVSWLKTNLSYGFSQDPSFFSNYIFDQYTYFYDKLYIKKVSVYV